MARTNPTPDLVCDAGPLIHLDELSCLDLLADFHAVLVPGLVWQEVARHRPKALEQSNLRLIRVEVALPDEVEFNILSQAFSLHAGEQAVLALMRQHQGAILLTDDTAARLVAEQLKIQAHGTLGVLLRAIRRGQRTPEEVVALLRTMPQRSSLHIRLDLLGAIIAQVQRELELG